MSHGEERRANQRFTLDPQIQAQLVANIRGHHQPVMLRDISVEGIGLVASQQFPEGVRLDVDLTNVVSGTHRAFAFQLICCQQLGRNWALGGPLVYKRSDEDLKKLLSGF